MDASHQEVIATLKSCLPIYHNLYNQVGYEVTEDDLECLKSSAGSGKTAY